MKPKLLAGLLFILLGASAGAAFGLWWSNDIEEEICARLDAECGEWAMPMNDCLQGRQHDLVRYGPGAMRRVKTCLAAAPHDCLSVTACIGDVDPQGP